MEIEVKFHVPAERRRALWTALSRGRTKLAPLQAHYFDTAAGLLAGKQISLRLRREDGQWVQTLKASGEDGADRVAVRFEHEVPVGEPGAAMPSLDISRHAGSPAGERLRKVLKKGGRKGGDARLVEVFRTEVDRQTRLFKRAGGLIVEAALDQGWLIAGDARHEICEIEFELKAGPLSGLFPLATDWLAAHGLWLDTVAKGARGELLRKGQLYAEAVKARVPAVDESMDAAAFARATCAACLDHVMANASAVAQGSESAEHIHQLRVGLRRLRTAISELAEFNAGIDPGWEHPLAEVFGALGEARDRHMLETALRGDLLAAGAPGVPVFDSPASPTPTPVSQVVRAGEFQCCLLAVLAFVMKASPVAGTAFEGTTMDALADRLDHLHGRLRHSAKTFTALAVEDQHHVRKQLKRLRYLAEFIGPLFRRSAVADYLDTLKPAQDALGRHNDEIVALQACREHLSPGSAEWFAIGWLSARQAVSAEAAAKALRSAGKAACFWRD